MNVYAILLAVIVVLALVLGNMWNDVQTLKSKVNGGAAAEYHPIAAEPVVPSQVAQVDELPSDESAES